MSTADGPTLDGPTAAVPRRASPSSSAVAFTPGQVLAGRYRIVGLLGRGGMGEVYRADDLKLGTAVALKFLPRVVERDSEALGRFHSEVRTARLVSHPHVCRVYDIDEVDGRHFISMEYVDGEDLATLLRRIGRLPPGKAIEIARQLCAGLAAAHDRNVLHRDLKPANVMLDGHGRVRITDFGLAVAGDLAVAEIAGTPAYMSPEQLTGQPATIQSDLYALGLVLYEIFTGRRAVDGGHSLPEWQRLHSETRPVSPSSHVSDIEPAVERVVLRCLEKDPSQRPRSAAQVALALPGSDPLAAAIAAGETPSPAMVAAAGGEGALEPKRAWSWLAMFVVLMGTVSVLAPYATDMGLAPMKKSPDVLRERARAIVQRFGYTDTAKDETSWLERDYATLRWLADHLRSTDWRRRLSGIGSPVRFHYRRDQKSMNVVGAAGAVTDNDPPFDNPGAIRVVLDAEGRLRELHAIPPQWVVTPSTTAAVPIEPVFQEAGLDPSRFQAVAPEWMPPVPFDERREWTGSHADLPELPLRVSVASFGSRVTSVAVLGPWSRDAVRIEQTGLSFRIQQATLLGFITVMLGASVVFALRNVRAGRGDRRGAFRLAAGVAALYLFGWLVIMHPSREAAQLVLGQALGALGEALRRGCLGGVLYLAVEPYVRRRMPELLVGWARLLEGRVSDPRVGRDVLLGCAIGAAVVAIIYIVNGLPTFIPFPAQTPVPSFAAGPALVNRMVPLASISAVAEASLIRALTSLVFLFVCRLLLPRPWQANGATAVLFTLLALGGENPVLETPGAILIALILTYTVTQLGLLTFVAMWAVLLTAMFGVPIGVGLTEWYAPYTAGTMALLMGLVAWSFHVSLGGKSAFGSLSLDS